MAVNEPLIGWYLGPFMSDLPGWDAASLDVSNFTLRRVQASKRDQFFAREFSDVWLPSLRRMMLERFGAHVARYPPKAVPPSKAVVVLKEPNGSQSADVLSAALPRSRLLFLLRDGRDVVDSELAANLPGSWVAREYPGGDGVRDADRLDFVVQSAHKWLWRTEVVREAYASHRGPKRLLRYEDLLGEPVSRLAQVFDWLGLPVPNARVEEIVQRHAFEGVPEDKRGYRGFWRAASPGLWRQSLRAEERAALAETLGPKLRELGYET